MPVLKSEDITVELNNEAVFWIDGVSETAGVLRLTLPQLVTLHDRIHDALVAHAADVASTARWVADCAIISAEPDPSNSDVGVDPSTALTGDRS